MKTRTTTLIAGTLVLAACGGGSDDSTTDESTAPDTTASETTTPETTAPETTAPETTAPETTAPETTAPETTEAPETTVALAETEEFQAFCRASENYFVTAEAIFEYVNSNAAAEQLFPEAIAEAANSVDAAPTPGFATEPGQALTALQQLTEVLAPVGFDVEQVDPDAIAEPFGVIETTTESLKIFLTDGCGSELSALDDRAIAIATDFDERFPGGSSSDGDTDTDGDTDEPVGETAEIADDSGILRATVPGAWSEVRGAPDGEVRQLIAAPDVDAYLASFNLPGMYLLSGNADDAAATLPVVRDAIRTQSESQGCSVSISAPYDDGVYTGQEDFLECPGGDAVLHLIGGTNSENDTWFVMLLVVEFGDDTTRQLIGDSFFVD